MPVRLDTLRPCAVPVLTGRTLGRVLTLLDRTSGKGRGTNFALPTWGRWEGPCTWISQSFVLLPEAGSMGGTHRRPDDPRCETMHRFPQWTGRLFVAPSTLPALLMWGHLPHEWRASQPRTSWTAGLDLGSISASLLMIGHTVRTIRRAWNSSKTIPAHSTVYDSQHRYIPPAEIIQQQALHIYSPRASSRDQRRQPAGINHTQTKLSNFCKILQGNRSTFDGHRYMQYLFQG
jgi:hypothetical protein